MSDDHGRAAPRPLKPLEDSNVAIVGVVRNCAFALEAEVARLADAFADAARIEWLLIESDSTDDTLGALAALARKVERFDYASEGVLAQRIPSRTARIAHCRNVYRTRIAEREDLDYVVVADFDAANGLLTRGGVRSCWTRADWDVCAANQLGPYYDIWALRHPTWCPDDYMREFAELRKTMPRRRAWRQAVEARMIRIPPTDDWIEVGSAFGGLAIYWAEVLRAGPYLGADAEGRPKCEHVALHEAIAGAGGRLFINPALINCGVNEHTFMLNYPPLIRRVGRFLRGVLTRRTPA